MPILLSLHSQEEKAMKSKAADLEILVPFAKEWKDRPADIPGLTMGQLEQI